MDQIPPGNHYCDKEQEAYNQLDAVDLKKVLHGNQPKGKEYQKVGPFIGKEDLICTLYHGIVKGQRIDGQIYSQLG